MFPPVAFANLDPNLPHKDVERAIAAYQRKLAYDFAPVNGIYTVLHYVGNRALADDEVGIVFDPRTSSEYLGEHNLEKVPRGVVLTGACKAYGEDPFETGSHELDELLMDPSAAINVTISDDGTEEAYEMDDPVQGTSYIIDGISVANFVHQLAYFNECGSQYDHRKVLKAPHTTTLQGYCLRRKPGQQWQQLDGERVSPFKALENAHKWDRRMRRIKKLAAALAKVA